MSLTPQKPDDTRDLEIGLVMAGAVSAGAYTGGVLDFLIQALDEWEGNPAAPRVRIKLKSLSGTSAGGMCAAIGAVCLQEEFVPVTDPATATGGNKLFNAWVRRVDLLDLLRDDDLRQHPTRSPLSALDGTVLDATCEEALELCALKVRATVDAPLHVVMATTNLRGVPYHADFVDGAGGKDGRHSMVMHADYLHFRMEHEQDLPPGAFAGPGGQPGDGLPLVVSDRSPPTHWGLFRQATLATGAFPIGLPPRDVSSPEAAYKDRRWRVVTTEGESPPDRPTTFTSAGRVVAIDPDRAIPPGAAAYHYVSLDGGMMDNEPFVLGGAKLTRNPDATSATVLCSTLVMIDPFPDSIDQTDSPAARRFESIGCDLNLLHVAWRAVRSFVEQSRFKPDAVGRATDVNYYDRFVVAPAGAIGRRPDQLQLASGGLGGFGGFLAEAFRRHDYQLGRRNCQKFLSDHFILPLYAEGTTDVLWLFKDWPKDCVRHYLIVRARNADGRVARVSSEDAGKLVDWTDERRPVLAPGVDRTRYVLYLPIIPLTGRARVTVPEPAWPTVSLGWLRDRLTAPILARLRAVSGRVLQVNVPHLGLKLLGYLARWWWSEKIARSILAAIEDDIWDQNLIERP